MTRAWPPHTGKLTTRDVPWRGLHREEAAMYIGVGTSKFDEMVSDGRMPKPKQIDSRRVWDIRALDRAFDALPGASDDDLNPFDQEAD